jgi:peptidoglycan/xylan/chitin deacetylase (PgdA/CDA1 family)
MRLAAAFIIIGITGFTPDASWATRPPALPVYPYQNYDVRIVASRHFGVVPFAIDFEVVVDGYEKVEMVHWDFDGDGSADAHGLSASYTFSDPTDHEVTAEISTTFHGTLLRVMRITGHTALMTITFDDGPVSVHYWGLPLLASKGVTATAYIVPAWVGPGSYLDWEEITELHEAGWVIGSHTMTHADLTQVDDSTLHYELSKARSELLQRGFPASHLAVPHGAYDAHVIDAIRLYYDTNRIIGGPNPLPEHTEPYLLGSHASTSWLPFEAYCAQIDSAVARRGWYIMCNHSVDLNCYSYPWCISTEMLSDVIDYAHSKRVKTVNMDEALEMMSPDQWEPQAGVVADGGTATTSPLQGLRVIHGYRQATIRYGLVNPTQLGIRIFDVRGRLLSTLLHKQQGCGEHTVIWNGTDSYGRPVEAGIYFCDVKAGNTRQCRKIQLVH